jgi:thiol:disulfide interchange protein DsbD
MVSYAYEEETALFFRVMVPADAVEGAPIPLALEADWLVCKEVCFIGSGSDRLELSVGGSAEPREADAAALRRARGRLPLPFEGRSSWSVAFHAEEETGKQVGTLRLECPQPVTDFFPDPSGGLRLRSKTVSPREGGGSILELVLETRGDPSEKTARGLLRIRLPDGDGHREINVPVIKETKR